MIRNVQHARSVLAPTGEHDPPAKVMRHQHEPVTNPQYRNAYRKNFRIDLRRAFVVNTGRPAGKDQAIGLHCRDFGGRCVEPNNLRIHLAFPDPSRNDLRVLRAEIEDENSGMLGRF